MYHSKDEPAVLLLLSDRNGALLLRMLAARCGLVVMPLVAEGFCKSLSTAARNANHIVIVLFIISLVSPTSGHAQNKKTKENTLLVSSHLISNPN